MGAWQPAGQVPRLRVYLPEVVTPGNENAGETWRALGTTVSVTTIPGDHESMLTAGELHQAVATVDPTHQSQRRNRVAADQTAS